MTAPLREALVTTPGPASEAPAKVGVEVHTDPPSEIGVNGSGGPTCKTRPIFSEVGAAA